MGQLREEIFVCLDCESTGLDLDKDKIIEVAAQRFTFSSYLESFESLVDPQCPIPAESQAIHHISEDLLKGKPKINEILPQLLKVIGPYPIVGHGVNFDIELISRAAKSFNIHCNIQNRPYIDTLRLARAYGDSPSNSLSTLANHFNITIEDTHRAMADVVLNIEVFKHLTRKFHTTEDLFRLLANPIRMKIMPLGKHKGRPFSEIPLDYLQWAAKMNFDQDLLFSIRSELKRRRQGGGFSQATNPFNNIL